VLNMRAGASLVTGRERRGSCVRQDAKARRRSARRVALRVRAANDPESCGAHDRAFAFG